MYFTRLDPMSSKVKQVGHLSLLMQKLKLSEFNLGVSEVSIWTLAASNRENQRICRN